MSLILDANLQAQLDTETRKPIFELSSVPAQSSLPFVGQQLHTTNLSERWPDNFVHSDGSYVAVFSRQDTGTETNLYLKTSAVDRNTWVNPPATITAAGNNIHYEYPSCCELTGGSIGVFVTERNSTTGAQKLRFMVIDKDGAILVALTDAHAAQPANMKYYESCVRKMSDGTYLMVVALDNNGTWELRRSTHAAGSTWPTTPGVLWATTVAMAFSGATVTGEKRRPFIGDIVKGVSTQEQWLFFDRVDATSGAVKNRNIYYGKALDKLAAALAITKLTNITQIYQADEDPSFAQVNINSFVLAYMKRSVSILLNATSVPPIAGNIEQTCQYLHIDEANNWLIMMDFGVFSGNVHSGVHVINLNDLTIRKRYFNDGAGGTSSPKLYNHAGISCYWYAGAGKLIVGYATSAAATSSFDLIDIINDSVTPIFDENTSLSSIPTGGYRITGVNLPLPARACCFDGQTLWWIGTAFDGDSLCKVDLSGVGPDIASTKLVNVTRSGGLSSDNNTMPQAGQYATFWDLNTKVLYAGRTFLTNATADREGFIVKLDMNSGAVISVWRKSARGIYPAFSGFPGTGVNSLWVEAGKLYFSTVNNNTIYPGEPIGMGIVSSEYLLGEVASYFNDDPVETDHTLNNLNTIKSMGNGKLLLCTLRRGLGIYNDPTSGLASVYDEVSVPGFPVMGSGNPLPITDAVFDAARNRIYLSFRPRLVSGSTIQPAAVLIFDLDGDIIQPLYVNVTALDSTPSFSSEQKLVATDEEENLTLMKNGAGDGIAAFWSRRVSAGTEYDLYFDEEIPDFDLLPYLSEDDPLEVVRTLEHEPNAIEFALKGAHLFDPLNNASLLRSVVAPGRKVKFRKGERTPAGDFLVDLFTGYVDSGAQTYARQTHPTRRVRCYDITKYLGDTLLVLTPSYGDGQFPGKPDGDNPSTGILAHMASTMGGMPNADIAFGTFENTQDLVFQLASISPYDAMEVVANRFHRVIYVDGSGKITVKRIDPSIAISDTMNDNKKTIEVNPDENESENTNRVTVKGISDTQLPVVYPEQLIKEYSGITGWVQDPKDVIYIPYSDDFSIEAVDARLKWVTWQQQAGPYPIIMPFTAATVAQERVVRGGDILSSLLTPTNAEQVEFMNRRGVRIKMGMFKFAVKVLTQIAVVGVVVLTVLSFIPGFSAISTGVILGMISAMTLLLNALTKQFFYVVQVYAKPSGLVRQEIQASADDIGHQQSIGGRIVERAVDYPLAFNIPICQDMADWFLFRIQLARSIVRVTTLGHLKHEPGDVIQFKHPESGELLRGYIHEIRHTIRRGEDGVDSMSMTLGVY